MYDYFESTRRLVKSKGVQYTLDRIFSGELSELDKNGLERDGITRNGIPCLSLILSFAN